ncbi:MAG: acyl-CoA thioesterase [Clostridia bacterium]|nr:acyl-CoA thioesterase [Clostridia bacterium]
MNAKRVSDSRTQQVQILSQSTLNGYKRLFGGRLMEWIDIVAAVTARRHCNMNVTTAAVDKLIFKKPAFANDTVVLEGYITYAGKTSMEICVETCVEALDGSRTDINKAYLVMVAIDDDGNPAPVPELIIETEEERRKYQAALKRRRMRKLRSEEHF